MNRPVLIIGGGGHAKVLIDALRLRTIEIIGITDPDPARKGAIVSGVPILGDDAVVDSYRADQIHLVNALGAVDVPRARKDIFERFKKKGFSFVAVMHPSAVVAADAELGEGAQIMAGSIVQPGCRIGANTIVNTKASVDHDCIIGDHVHLAPGVTLSGSVQIGSSAHIGTGAVIIQGITIGANSVVAAGAVVVRDVANESLVMGVPAKAVTE